MSEDASSDDEDAPVAQGIETMDVETQIGEQGGPQVSGVSPDLVDKDPSDVTMEDIKGLPKDEKEQVLQIMAARDRESSQDDSDTETPAQSQSTTDVTESGFESAEDLAQSSHNATESGSDEAVNDDSTATSDTANESEADGNDEDDIPESRTLAETGLIDENGEFPWEGESLGTTAVGEGGPIEKFRYKQTNFEIHEPEDRQRFESNFEQLADIEEIDDRGKRRATADRYSRKLADQCLTVDGHPIRAVFRVSHEDTHYVVPDDDGSKGLESLDTAQKLWAAMSWYDRFKISMLLGESILGERQFRQRFD